MERILSSTSQQLPEAVAVHLEICETCRAHATGLRAAPAIFTGAPLYHAAVKHRTLAAVDAAQASTDVRFGLVLALPVALSFLLSVLGQVYIVHFACSTVLHSDLLAWTVSIAIAWASGVSAGLLVLILLARGSRPARQAYGGVA